MSKEFRCEGYCPVQTLRGCCSHCAGRYDEYKTKENEHLWTKEFGWWNAGCNLGEQRPQPCKEYDCRDYDWVVTKRWVNGNWRVVDVKEIPMGFSVAGIVGIEKKNGDSS